MIHDRVLTEYRRMMSSRQVLGWKGICIRYGFLILIYILSGLAVLISWKVFPNWPLVLHLAIGLAVSLAVLWLCSSRDVFLMKASLQIRYRDDQLSIDKTEITMHRTLKVMLDCRIDSYLE